MRKIAVLNQKGGVGKTTTVTNVAAYLAMNGQKVAVIDFDPQAHLTIHLGAEPETLEKSAYTVMTGQSEFKESLIQARENLWLLGASIDLVGAESELVSVVGRETILREAIQPCEDDFDYLLIDCPPSLGLLTLNSLATVDEVMIPIQPHFLALQGFGKLLQTVTLVNKRINPNLKVSAILLCMFDSRTSLSGEVKTDISEFLAGARESETAWSDAKVIPVHIRRNIKLAEAPSYGKTIFEYENQCNGAEDYARVAEIIAGQEFGNQKSNEPQETKAETSQKEPENIQEPIENNEDTPETEQAGTPISNKIPEEETGEIKNNDGEIPPLKKMQKDNNSQDNTHHQNQEINN